MAKGKRRKRVLQDKSQRKAAMLESGKKSNYAKKMIYLGRTGDWGFNFPEKPWKN
jgi:hypothetical protein